MIHSLNQQARIGEDPRCFYTASLVGQDERRPCLVLHGEAVQMPDFTGEAAGDAGFINAAVIPIDGGQSYRY